MHPSAAVMGAPDSARDSNSSNFSDDDAGIFMTIDNESGTEFFAVEPPRAVLTKDSSQNEKQISVDPVSLQGPKTIRKASFRLVSSPVSNNGSNPNDPPSPLPPPKLKFVSSSLPTSASSSPENVSSKKNHEQGAPRNSLTRMQSVIMDDTHLAMVEASTRRKSKSLGEGRASGPADDFDLWLEKSSSQKKTRKHQSSSSNNNSNSNKIGSVSKPPLGPSNTVRNNSTIRKSKSRDTDHAEDKFKCGKLCLFLPRGGKGKTVRSISSTSTISQASGKTEPLAISRRVSMEKFECGSWASSLENEGGESANLFFDLPMEMLRCSVSDMQSPVSAAFVFDNDDDNNDSSSSNNNNKKDKDIEMDFHAFLEAQS